MGRRKDEGDDGEAAAARNFVMARLAACRAALRDAGDGVDDAIGMFVDPSEDLDGKERRLLLEGIDDAIGDAARAVQTAQDVVDAIDWSEGEADVEGEGDGDDD